jgi:plastocyanin
VADFNYSPNNLTARAGQQVQVTVRNNGQLPHTFTIDGVANTNTIAAGATGTASFTPSATGTLVFYCTIHGRQTMSGQLTVTSGASGQPSGSPAAGVTSSTSDGYVY